MKRLWSICIFLCVPFLTKAQFEAAISNENDGRYDLAALAYERVIYENSNNDSVVNASLVRKSQLLKQNGQHHEAIETLLRGNPFGAFDTLNYQIRYELALNYYLHGQFEQSQNQLVQIRYYAESETQKATILPLEIFTLNELMEWEQAEIKMREYVALNNLPVDVEDLYAFQDDLKLKKVKTAKILSTILPGVGQIYAGYWFKGLVSGGIQAGLVAFSAYSLYTGYFFSGALAGVSLFYLFYMGGIDLAEDLVHQKNKEILEKPKAKIRKVILDYELNKKSG